MSEHRHIDATTTRCTDCGTYCTVDRPCYCCLAAEVDDLKARLISALAPAEPSYEELQAQVQRVRELMPPGVSRPTLKHVAIRCSDVLTALDR